MNRKIVIVMTYYERQYQFNRTLKSIAKSAHPDVEIVIVDDASPTPLEVPENYKYPIHVLKTTPEEKFWNYCPVIPYNRAIYKALDLGAEIVVLQNPENFHVGDCLSFVDAHLTENNYVVLSCFSINKELTFTPNIEDKFPGLEYDYPHTPLEYCGTGWYNHAHIRPCFLDFFSAITARNMRRINGFDERFAYGIAYGDDDLLRRIRNANIEPWIPEGPYVVHQCHTMETNPYSDHEAVEKNKLLLNTLHSPSCIAVHTHTPDLNTLEK